MSKFYIHEGLLGDILFSNKKENYLIQGESEYKNFTKKYGKLKRYYPFDSEKSAFASYLHGLNLDPDDCLFFGHFNYNIDITANKWDKIKNKKVIVFSKEPKKETIYTIEELCNKLNFKINIKDGSMVSNNKDNPSTRKELIKKSMNILRINSKLSPVKKSIKVDLDKEDKESFIAGEIDIIPIGSWDIWKTVKDARTNDDGDIKFNKDMEQLMKKCTADLKSPDWKIDYNGDWDDGTINLELN